MSPRTPMRGRNDTEVGIYKVDKWGQPYSIHYSRRSAGLTETAIVSDQSKIFFYLLIPLYRFLVRQFVFFIFSEICNIILYKLQYRYYYMQFLLFGGTENARSFDKNI